MKSVWQLKLMFVIINGQESLIRMRINENCLCACNLSSSRSKLFYEMHAARHVSPNICPQLHHERDCGFLEGKLRNEKSQGRENVM